MAGSYDDLSSMGRCDDVSVSFAVFFAYLAVMKNIQVFPGNDVFLNESLTCYL